MSKQQRAGVVIGCYAGAHEFWLANLMASH
jgi:hypothetical protein